MPEVGARTWIFHPTEMMVTLAGLLIVLLTLALGRVNSTIVLITPTNYSIPFPDIEASFAPRVPSVGIMGVVFAANSSNACEPLQKLIRKQNGPSAFVLVERGGCDFVTKVKHAQDAGYDAIIVYNTEGQDLVTMSGSGAGILIYAVFVSKQAGEALQLHAGDMNSRCYMFPAFENTARSVMAVSFISLLTVFAVLSTLFFVRRHRLRLNSSGLLKREPGGMTLREVKALPIILFDSGGSATVETCAICLEEYTSGEKLRILPCRHEFHVACIDKWLTTRRPFCPICKQDAHAKSINPPPSEHTPLLTSFATQFGSMVPSIPVATQNPSIRSPLNYPGNPFTRTPHAVQHTLSCPISQFYGEQDETALSCSQSSNTLALSSTSSVTHTICSLNSASGSCNVSSNINNSASVSEKNVENEGHSTGGHGGDLC